MPRVKSSACRYLNEDGKQCQNPPVQGKDLCEWHSGQIEMDVAVFTAVTDHFKRDIQWFFDRSNFFLVAEAALLSVFFVLIKDRPTDGIDIIMLGIALAGLALVVFWWFAVRGSLFWINYWREEAQRLSAELSRFRIYHESQEVALANPTKSPEKIAKCLPRLFGVIWLLMLVVVFLDGFILFGEHSVLGKLKNIEQDIKTVRVHVTGDPISPSEKRIKTFIEKTVVPPPPLDQVYRVYFNFDSAKLTPDAQKQIKGLFQDLGPEVVANIELEAHADRMGNPKYNKDLSRRRAKSVRDALVALGFKQIPISIIPYGENRPPQFTRDCVAELLNRVVEIRVRTRSQ